MVSAAVEDLAASSEEVGEEEAGPSKKRQKRSVMEALSEAQETADVGNFPPVSPLHSPLAFFKN